MTDLFTIDCHACGAKNTIDTETMRRVETDQSVEVVTDVTVTYAGGGEVDVRSTTAGCFFHCTCDPKDAA